MGKSNLFLFQKAQKSACIIYVSAGKFQPHWWFLTSLINQQISFESIYVHLKVFPNKNTITWLRRANVRLSQYDRGMNNWKTFNTEKLKIFDKALHLILKPSIELPLSLPFPRIFDYLFFNRKEVLQENRSFRLLQSCCL